MIKEAWLANIQETPAIFARMRNAAFVAFGLDWTQKIKLRSAS
jgi:hypothetical protein